jgi:hypothetical protein
VEDCGVICPKCGFEQPDGGTDCLRCGIVFSRFRAAPAATAAALPRAGTGGTPLPPHAGRLYEGQLPEAPDGAAGGRAPLAGGAVYPPSGAAPPPASVAPPPAGSAGSRDRPPSGASLPARRRVGELDSARRMYEGDRAGETDGQLYEGPDAAAWAAPGEALRLPGGTAAGSGGPRGRPLPAPRPAASTVPQPATSGGLPFGGFSAARPSFSAPEVLSDTGSIVFSNLLPFLFIAAVVYVPVVAATLLVTAGGGLLAKLLELGVSLLATPVVTGALTYGVAQELRGRQASVGDCLRIGLGSTVQVLGISILTSLFLFLGFVAFLVPGLYLASALCVAVPVAIEERPGIFNSLRRSRDLTEGNRLPILGVLLLITIAGGVVQWLILHLLAGTVLAGQIPLAAVRMVDTMFEATANAVMYYRLRSVREGLDVSNLTSVFD